MPRVIEKTKNRAGRERSCGRCGKKIEPGERYLSWSFRYGGTHYRCVEHPPKRSELTQSKMGEVYAAIEGAEADLMKATTAEEVQEAVRSVGEVANEVAQEYREAAEPFGGEGENAERADELEYWAGELEYWEADQDESVQDQCEDAEGALGECPL